MEYLIKNGIIVDGTGSQGYRADIGVENGYIVFIGNGDNLPAERIIDAQNQIITPGFIDVHAHYDCGPFVSNTMEEKLMQGVTTLLVGACGYSVAPICKENASLLDTYISFMKSGAELNYQWDSVGNYLKAVEKLGVGTNFAMLVGHGTLRIDAMGFENRKPSAAEMDRMKERLTQALSEGAFGMSVGLFYAPGSYADEEELTELASVMKNCGGIYVAHMRDESERLMEAVDETLRIAEKAGVPGHIHHMKCMGTGNWKNSPAYMKKIQDARDKRMDITGDQYPYTFGSTSLRGLLPDWAQSGGVEQLFKRLEDKDTREKILYQLEKDRGWSNPYLKDCSPEGITMVYAPYTPEIVGKNLKEISEAMQVRPAEAMLYIIYENHGMDTGCLELMCEEDIEYIMKQPFVMVGSDSNQPADGALCHPRTYGTFIRFLKKYCIDNKVVEMEEGIRKMTSLPASRLGLTNKGIIKEGMDADLNIIELEKLEDRASLQNPKQFASGVNTVLINGEIVVEDGKYNGKLAGRVLRK